jgi:hypothetical protein
METKDPDQEAFEREDLAEEYSFDEFAMGLASGNLTRARALKLVTASILGILSGGLLGVSVAEARRRKGHRRKGHRINNPISSACPGRKICPQGFPGTGSTGCCPSGALCCSSGAGGGCCPSGNGCCVSGGDCCPSSGVCCATGGCCPSDFPVCFTGNLCRQQDTGGSTTPRLSRIPRA